jgi:hypothetical protein
MASDIDRQVKALVKKLSKLKESSQSRIVKGAVGKGLVVIRKGIRDAVPPKYKDAKKAIGSSFKKSKRKDQLEAKVGSGVGIKFKKIRKDASKRAESKRKKTGGVGISAANLHWFIMGTDFRQSGYKLIRRRDGTRYKKSTGNRVANRGKMPAVLAGIVEKGFNSSKSQAMAAIESASKAGLIKETQRLASKK